MPLDALRGNLQKTGLALDTSFSRALGRTPEQIFPPGASSIPKNTTQTLFTSRFKGLRPSPLDLTSAISPSDRAITIGLEVPTVTHAKNRQNSASSSATREPPTPSIVITPANDNFETSDSKEPQRGSGYRPASSVYSRRATYITQEGTPPVPPLPTFIPKYLPRESNVTIFEEQEPQDGPFITERSVKRLTSQSSLPTPRRSRGWWNVITSPFSCTHSGSFFSRSPSIPEEEHDDTQSILPNASSLGTRGSDRHEIHSAPISCTPAFGSPSCLKRSGTAPASFPSEESTFDIYSLPTTGEAAEYYEAGLNEDVSLDRSITRSTCQGYDSDVSSSFNDSHQISDARRQPTYGQAMFCTPSEREMHGQSPDLDSYHPSVRQSRHGVIESYFSPMTDTPTIEDAHVGHFMGPGSTTDLRQIDLGTSRPKSPPPRLGLGEATISHRWEREPTPQYVTTSSHHTDMYASHGRSGSYGLGISEPNSLKAKHGVPPVPEARHPSEKEQLNYGPSSETASCSFAREQSNDSPWYERFAWWIFSGIGVLVVLVVTLCVLLTSGEYHDISVEAQWVNTTGFPPLPTGVTTMSQAQAVESESGCVKPKALWSCGIPTERHTNFTTVNFRFVIRFRNGTVPNNETQLSTNTSVGSPSARARSVVKRDFFSDSVYQANPPPPSGEDQLFIGQSTDDNTGNAAGEQTPFFMSLIDAADLVKKAERRIQKRDGQFPFPIPDSQSPGTSTESGNNVTTSASETIPKPALDPDGEPVPPTVYPLAAAQPLRLYDRGQDSEHYGFYTYFDKSVYVANVSAGALTDAISTNVSLSNATAVCTWSQTRMLVQIWTRKATVTDLGNVSQLKGVAAVNSTANVRTGHGSFPYAVTITVDRHGGDAARKGVYCYGLDDKHRVIDSAKTWVSEDRGFGGTLINPASVPGGNSQTTKLAPRNDGKSLGGIDGGTGGCACAWQNW